MGHDYNLRNNRDTSPTLMRPRDNGQTTAPRLFTTSTSRRSVLSTHDTHTLRQCQKSIDQLKQTVADVTRIEIHEPQPMKKSIGDVVVRVVDAVISVSAFSAGCVLVSWFVPKYCMSFFPELPQVNTTGFYRALQGVRNKFTFIAAGALSYGTECVRSFYGTNVSDNQKLLDTLKANNELMKKNIKIMDEKLSSLNLAS